MSSRTSLSWGMRKLFYRQASSQISNGLTLVHVLEEFSKRLARRKYKRQSESVQRIASQVRNGKTLVAAMGPGLTDLERSVLDAGEHAGRMAESMQLILEVREMTARMRQKLQASFFAPAVYLVTLYAVLYVIGASIVPQFLDVLPLEKWTGWAKVMYLMGHVAVGWTAPVLFLLLVAYGGISWWALPRWCGAQRTTFDQYIFPFPVYREITGFTWLMSFVALLRAGVPDTVAIGGQIKTASPWLASRLRAAQARLRNGEDLPTALRLTGYGFPSLDLIDELSTYAGFSDSAAKLDAVCREYAQTLERQLLMRGALIGGIFSGFMFMAFVVVQLGSNSLSSILTSSMGRM